jgi:C-terminal processing protease CtpA/Prc
LRTAVVAVAGWSLVPAVLWWMAAAGVLAFSAAIAEKIPLPRAAVGLALVGAFLSAVGYLLTRRERQPDEACLWAAAALWLALLGAAAFDLSDLARGPGEAALVWATGIAVFFSVWVPYVWSRCAALPHAAAWTLAAVAALPGALACLFASQLTALHPVLPLAGAILSAAAGFAAARFAARRLPASARSLVWVAAVCLLWPVWLGGIGDSHLALGLAAVGSVLMVVLLGVERVSWSSLLSERGLALLPVAAVVATLFSLSRDLLVLVAYAGGAVAVGAWGIVVVRRSGRNALAQAAAAKAALARLRHGALAGAMLATAVLCGFVVTGLAWDRSSAQMLVWLRAAGFPDIDEIDVVRSLLYDEYLWRGQAVRRARPLKLDSLLDGWALPERDRWTAGGWGPLYARDDREEVVGTGLLVAFEGRTATVVFTPEGSPAYAAGIRRGDRLVLRREHQPDADAAPRKRRRVFPLDFPQTITVASPDGKERTVELEARPLRDRRVVRVRTIDVAGQPVGYIALQRFDPVAEHEFVEAVDSLRAKGVRALVLDLRYNPGGYVRSAIGIAGAIVGERGRGQLFATTHHNPRYRDRDRAHRFRIPSAGGLALDRLVVITSGASCSASELLVKGLELYLPVATVGTTTCGKPVGSQMLDSGNWSYAVISFEVRNARGEGGYFDGLPPTCNAPDDVTRELGDATEASLREALHYIATGQCLATPARAVDESGVVL